LKEIKRRTLNSLTNKIEEIKDDLNNLQAALYRDTIKDFDSELNMIE